MSHANKLIFMTKYFFCALAGKPVCGPRSAFLNIFDRCNMDCIFCPVYKHDSKCRNQTDVAMNFSTFKNIIAQLKQMGTADIGLNGSGEPFLHPDIWQMVRYLHKEGLNCGITTNGALLDKSYIRKLVRYNVANLSVSIHAGTAPTYAAVRKGKSRNLFNDVKKNFEFLKLYKEEKGTVTPRVAVLNVICNKNFFEIPQMIRLASQLGAGYVGFKPLIRWNLPKYLPDFDSLELSKTQKITLIRNARDYEALAKVDGQKTNMELFVKQLNGILPQHCHAGFLATHIKTDGSVFPCWNATYPLGDIRNEPFKRIWSSNAYREFRRKAGCVAHLASENMDCRKCAFAAVDGSYYKRWPNAFLDYSIFCYKGNNDPYKQRFRKL